MLLFRSEENVASWCRAQSVPLRPRIRLDQLWRMAVTWYENRLTVGSRRPGPEEMVAIFAAVGLEGPFWDPRSDHWRSAT
jgi:hypothetical protein